MVLNENTKKALLAVGGVLGSALLTGFSLFLSKVIEPAIAWVSFASFRALIKITKSENLQELYDEMKKGYDGNKG